MGLMALLSIFLYAFHLLLLPSSGAVLHRSGQGGVPGGSRITPPGGLGPSPAPQNCVWVFEVYCPLMTTWWRPGSMTRHHLLRTVSAIDRGGLRFCIRQPWACLRVSPGQNWKLQEVYVYSLHPYTDGAQATQSPACYLFFVGHNVSVFTQKDLFFF